LRAAASLHFDLFDERGQLTPATFINVLEAPDGGVVVLARFAHAHAAVGATIVPRPRSDSGTDV
jgi:hypothetical protein